MDPQSPRFLIVRLSSAGDVVLCLPALHALRARFPEARVTWLVDDTFADLVRDQAGVDTVAAVPLRRWRKLAANPTRWRQLAREWREFRATLAANAPYDACLDMHGVFRGAALSALAPCGRRLAPRAGKPKLWRALLRSDHVPPRGPHLADRGLALAAALGADVSHPCRDFSVPPAAQCYAADLLAAHGFGCAGPLVALGPGSSAPSKCWPPGRFAALARLLHDRLGARIVLVGGPGDVEVSSRIIAEAGISALCAAGQTTWPQLAGLLRQCATLVCGDTGPMHLAAAVGTPVVALFGPTLPAASGPLGEGHLILEQPLPCRPCNPRHACPDVPCMAGITVDDVAQAVTRILAA